MSLIRVKLLKSNRIDGHAGKIVAVSPARAAFLMEVGMAEIWEQTETPEKAQTKETAAKTARQTAKKTAARTTK